MIRTIMIEDQPIEINSSLGWLFCYREQFGHDILPDLLPLLEAAAGAVSDFYEENGVAKIDNAALEKMVMSLSTLEVLTIVNILWAMARNAGDKRTPLEFANSFDPFPFETVAPDLFWTIVKSCSSSKNLQSLIDKIPMEKIPSAFKPYWLVEQAED